MAPLINLIILVLIFCIAAYGAFWICAKAGLPQPVLWIVGVIFLIVILLFISGQIHAPVLYSPSSVR